MGKFLTVGGLVIVGVVAGFSCDWWCPTICEARRLNRQREPEHREPGQGQTGQPRGVPSQPMTSRVNRPPSEHASVTAAAVP